MQQSLFKKLLELSKKTGDRIVFADVEGSEAYVVLPLEDYEKLVTGSPITLKKEITEQPKTSPLVERVAEYEPTNALLEISREVVKTLEVERLEDAKPVRLAINDELELEPEERYYLEPLE